jgi:hypothetical protein
MELIPKFPAFRRLHGVAGTLTRPAFPSPAKAKSHTGKKTEDKGNKGQPKAWGSLSASADIDVVYEMVDECKKGDVDGKSNKRNKRREGGRKECNKIDSHAFQEGCEECNKDESCG